LTMFAMPLPKLSNFLSHLDGVGVKLVN